jgi:hypothetical protein
MIITLRAVTVATTLGLLSPALAQNVDVATDFELKAGYCIGYYQDLLANYPRLGEALNDPAMRAHDEAGIHQTGDRLTRLQAYLAAKGFFLPGARGSLAKAGVAGARQRGQTDATSCTVQIKRCADSCRPPDCDLGCFRNYPACQSTSACDNLQPPL